MLFLLKGCPAGHYGDACDKNCPANCRPNGETCDHDTGSCWNGCEDGWMGHNCTEST